MVSLTLLSTVLMGLLTIATLIVIERTLATRQPPRKREGDRYDRLVEGGRRLTRNPTVWTVAFLFVTVGLGAGAVVAVGDFGLSEGAAGMVLAGVYALIGLLRAGFVFLGAYHATRTRGLGNAHGVAAGSLALGAMFLLVIVATLLT